MVLLALFALSFFSVFQVAGQSARSSVALVKPKLTDEARAGFTKIAQSFSTQGYDDLAEYFQGWADGGYGSGVLVKAPSGTVVLVTNRHVAAYCETADISFQSVDGTTVSWPGCPILYIDPIVDIAVIGVPADKTAVVLPLAVETPQEGSEVWSAGYPGLDGRPVWQIAKGNITNSSVVLPELGSEKDSVFFQHSAPIAPGNSGGPLLSGSPDKPASFRVLGINAYSLRDRTNTYFSIPAAKVQEALKRYEERGGTTVADAARALTAFGNAPDWDKFAFRRLISYRYASDEGWGLFQLAVANMPDKDAQTWYGRFHDSPLDTVEQFLSYRLWKKIRASSADFSYVGVDTNAEGSIGRFLLGKTPIQVHWAREAGVWKVGGLDAPGSKTVVAPLQPAKTPIESGISFGAGATVPVGDAWNHSLGVGLTLWQTEWPWKENLTQRFRVAFTQDSPTKNDFAASPPADQYNFVEVGLGTNYYFTMPARDGYVAPYVGVTANADFALPMYQKAFFQGFGSTNSDEGAILKTFLIAGVIEPEIGIETSFDRRIAFGLNMRLRWFLFGLSGIKSIPIGVYVKMAAL